MTKDLFADGQTIVKSKWLDENNKKSAGHFVENGKVNEFKRAKSNVKVVIIWMKNVTVLRIGYIWI